MDEVPKPAVAGGSLVRPCTKCRAQEATLDSRSHAVCRDCFAKFISTKCIKQIAILGKEARAPGRPPAASNSTSASPRRYLLGLSLGVSSSVLLHLLNENVEFQLAKGRNAPFELTVVHVDVSSSLVPTSTSISTAPAAVTLEKYRQRYPRFGFQCVPLGAVFGLRTVDWSTLPGVQNTTPASPLQDQHQQQGQKLRQLFDGLASAAARTDVLRLLVRHVLVAAARDGGCQALLLGHSTTALAELTLAEAAKGRGFALPWLINDGPLPVVEYEYHGSGTAAAAGNSDSPAATATSMLVYHPLRDALRKELVTYATLTSPPLTALISDAPDAPVATSLSGGNAAVVSHKDLSIEEVMVRYFAEVEANYASVVANVARTTGKLVRLDNDGAGTGEEGARCGLCGMPLDEQGDERWRGELGEAKDDQSLSSSSGRICYGCERSTRG
ncbi:hypothetical protein B0T24DRAFT_664384 [Lasiosphaeria ovina]|uniref:Cytoplasmic tRNA 2-thiolation protein 2 n=1 Tax=Lasiosphaeria ovina TaxID=92902 RepID=A0AAE0TUF0_9PEZI|nr:hypothetical protein B0T24DRAFT_664384 [Lasiosphaeria ovina]